MFGRPTSGNFDIWEVNMLDDLPFGSAKRVDELSTEEFWESGPSVSPDGLEVFFHRSVPNGPFDIFISTRREPDLPWSTPVSLGTPVNMTTSSDAGPTRSSDGTLLYFESNRPGGLGNSDIWMSTRIGRPMISRMVCVVRDGGPRLGVVDTAAAQVSARRGVGRVSIHACSRSNVAIRVERGHCHESQRHMEHHR